jgi:hypothetical protein
LDWETLIFEGLDARHLKDKAQWKLGDLALAVERSYGDRSLEKYAEGIGVGHKALLNYRWVAEAYEFSTRVENLSWAHHRAVATRDDRLEMLKQAEAGKWSVRRMQWATSEVDRRNKVAARIAKLDESLTAWGEFAECIQENGIEFLTFEELEEAREFTVKQISLWEELTASYERSIELFSKISSKISSQPPMDNSQIPEFRGMLREASREERIIEGPESTLYDQSESDIATIRRLVMALQGEW